MRYMMHLCFLVMGIAFIHEFASAEGNASEQMPESAQKFFVMEHSEKTMISFHSVAPLEDIIGRSSSLTGYLLFDPENPEAGGRGHLSVPAAGFQTGIPLRDEHLASSDWLDADNYPEITFDISNVTDFVEVKKTESATTWDVTVQGELSMHGRTQHMETPGRVTFVRGGEAGSSGGLLAARTAFEFALDDFDITGPSGRSLIGAKVGETIQVEVTLMAGAESDSTMETP